MPRHLSICLSITTHKLVAKTYHETFLARKWIRSLFYTAHGPARWPRNNTQREQERSWTSKFVAKGSNRGAELALVAAYELDWCDWCDEGLSKSNKVSTPAIDHSLQRTQHSIQPLQSTETIKSSNGSNDTWSSTTSSTNSLFSLTNRFTPRRAWACAQNDLQTMLSYCLSWREGWLRRLKSWGVTCEQYRGVQGTHLKLIFKNVHYRLHLNTMFKFKNWQRWLVPHSLHCLMSPLRGIQLEFL